MKCQLARRINRRRVKISSAKPMYTRQIVLTIDFIYSWPSMQLSVHKLSYSRSFPSGAEGNEERFRAAEVRELPRFDRIMRPCGCKDIPNGRSRVSRHVRVTSTSRRPVNSVVVDRTVRRSLVGLTVQPLTSVQQSHARARRHARRVDLRCNRLDRAEHRV